MFYFVSDMHFNHANAIQFDPRPWETVEEMNAALIENWNARVTDKDTVYILGDLMWTIERQDCLDILDQLNGHLILIRGNHDNRWLHGDEVRAHFDEIKDYAEIKYRMPDGTKKHVCISHYPIFFYNHAHHDGMIIYGHVHATAEYYETLRIKEDLHQRGIPCEMYNAFCGLHNWAPATIEELMESGA